MTLKIIHREQDEYLNAIKKILCASNQDSFFAVFLNNSKKVAEYCKIIVLQKIVQLLQSCTSSSFNLNNILAKYKSKTSQYYFYCLYYKLLQYNLLSEKNKRYILNILKLPGDCFSSANKLDDINSHIAKIIITAINREDLLNQEQNVELKKIYYSWLKSLDTSFYPKTYISRKNKSFTNKPSDLQIRYTYLFYGRFVNASKKQVISSTKKKDEYKWFKSFFIFQANIAIVFTAIAQGFLPAVLVTTTSSALLLNILWVGVPSIIINYIFYNKSAHDLIKDIWHGRLLRSFWLGLLALIMAIGGGFSYSILMYSTTLAALQLIFGFAFPFVAINTVAFISVVLSVIIAMYTAIALTAMYYSSILKLELNPKKIFSKIKLFLVQNIKIKCFCYLCANIFLFVIIIGGAGYLALVEAGMFYGGVLTLFNVQWLSVVLVALATPANFIFSANIFYNFYLLLKNLPSLIINFFKYFKKKFSNPTAFYEDIKWLIKFSVLLIFNYDNSQGLAQGIAEETKNPLCKTFLSKFKVNPESAIVQALSVTTGGIDSFVANGIATMDTLGNPVFHNYGNYQESVEAEERSSHLEIASKVILCYS